MKHNILILAAAVLVCGGANAQKKFTLENTVPGGNEFNEYRVSSGCGYLANRTGDYIDLSESEAREDEINSVLKSNAKPPMAFIWAWNDKNTVVVYSYETSANYTVDLQNKRVTDSILEIYADPDFSYQGKYVAYSSDGNLFVCGSNGRVQVNRQKEHGVVYGTSVHRDEFGISSGTFWANKSQKLAFYRMDESMVTEYPKVNINERIATEEPFRYPMAGETSHEVSVGVYDVDKQSVIYLKTASPVNRYFTNIAWSADDKYILIAEINREQNHLWMNMYDATNGNFIKTIFEEQNNEWVEPCDAPVFVDNKQFVWMSERDGYKHLYLYNIDNSKCTQLTKGNYCVTGIYGASTTEIFYQCNQSGYLYRDVCKVNLKGKVTKLSSGLGIHNASFDKDFTKFIDVCSSPEKALYCTLRKIDGQLIKVLKEKENPYEGFKMPEIRLVNLKSADGKFPLSGRMILPVDFDSTKVYPVIDYVYGGPHSQMIDGSWLYGASYWMLYFAQQGYIVFSMDNRGTEYRGVEYEHCIHRRLGELEMQDQMEGVNYLKSLSYVDKNRIGIQGWSFGGFMTIDLLTTYPGVFKAGIAGGPVCDWQYYEVMYGERYMDTPQENPEGYANSAVVNKIGNLQDRLLVIHGDIDNVVVWQNSLMLLKKSIEAGVILDYFVYPGHEHNMIGHDRVHLYQKIERYFEDFLK
ncbi:MAG: DPP IV N-terminal domain-containing protein [Bacteroidales bacterium]|nr:DPP IV N-terminal domain-containing protein [Bacteroidales bacterium]